jgi:enoyl-CoA hydratase
MSSQIPEHRTNRVDPEGIGSREAGSSKSVAGCEFKLTRHTGIVVLTLASSDGMNRLTRGKVAALCVVIQNLVAESAPLIITGEHNFSVGADLNEIRSLTGPAALEFSLLGQSLMNSIAEFPTPVIAAISGHCMGGGFDLALACHRRIATPHAVFGHRGAALGLITGWGGTQRLPLLIGKGQALELLTAAEKIGGQRAFEIGLVELLAEDPVVEALRQLQRS